MHSEKDPYSSPPGSVHQSKRHQSGSRPGSHHGSRHPSVGSTEAPNIIALADYLQQQQQQQQHQQQAIDLTGNVANIQSNIMQQPPSITLEQLNQFNSFQRQHRSNSSQADSPVFDGSLLNSMLSQHHYHLVPSSSGPSSPGSPNHQFHGSFPHQHQSVSPCPSVYGGGGGGDRSGTGSGAMSPTKKLSKPLIEKRRRDRINRCLRLLKELVIDSKRFPVPNVRAKTKPISTQSITEIPFSPFIYPHKVKQVTIRES